MGLLNLKLFRSVNFNHDFEGDKNLKNELFAHISIY